MRLESEDRPPVENATAAQVKRTIARLKSYGKCSFASLTDESGNYLQVAGGRFTCMMEKRDVSANRHFRAFQNKKSGVFEDGTELAFGGGNISLMSDEWFTSTDVEEVFLAFLNKKPIPEWIRWRNITGIFELKSY